MTTLSFDVLWRDRGASKGMQDLGRHTDRAAKSFRALKVGAGIALVAAGAAAVKFGTSSVKAYVEAEKSQIRLQDAFARFPKLADVSIGSLQKYNSQLALKTRFDDDATASGQAVLAQFGLTGQQLTKLTPLLQDYAAKTGKDLPAAAGVLGKAFLGNTRALKAIGIDYKMTGDKGKDFANIQRLVNEKVGGFAEKEGKSAAGQAEILRNRFGELQEAAGQKLLPALTKVVGGLTSLVGFVSDNSAIFKTLGKTIKIVFSSIAESVGIGKGSFKDFSDWVATHQEDITAAIIKGGKASIEFGKALVTASIAGLRAFGHIADGIGEGVSFILGQYADMAHGAALAFGWIPGIGPKLMAADVKFRLFAFHAKDNTHKVGDAARGAADSLEGKLLPGLTKAGQGLDAYGRKAITAAQKRDIVAKAENRHRDALIAASKAAKENGKTLDSNTVAGSANRAALARLVGTSQNYISKLTLTGASSKKVTAATKDARAEFIRVAEKMGIGSAKAKDLAEKYFKIPKKVSTKTEQPGMSDADRKAKNYKNRLDDVPKKVSTNIGVKFASSGKVQLNVGKAHYIANATGGVLPGYTPGRDVHRFYSASPGVPDLHLSGGEAIMRPEWTRAVGGPKAVARMNRDATQGKAAAFAGGGTIPSMSRATTGAQRVSEDAGKAVARLAAAAVVKATMAALRKAAADAAAAGGGPVGKGGYASALSYARAHRGHPYIYASLWDCSGFMSALHSIILGQRPHRRYTTTAFHGAHAAGFTRGKRSPFMVGVRPLSGKFGHMAGTLNGVNVESAGGVGVRVGGRARGAHSGMFSWRGGLAKGGVIGDLPFDLLDPQGERYNPELADLIHKAGYHRGGRIGAKGPERVLSPVQNRHWEHLTRVMDRSSGRPGNTTIIINAPNYIGSRDELRQTLVEMNRRGQLEVIKR
jgi:hypothetical protein